MEKLDALKNAPWNLPPPSAEEITAVKQLIVAAEALIQSALLSHDEKIALLKTICVAKQLVQSNDLSI